MINTLNVINIAILIYFVFSVVIYSFLLMGSFITVLNYFKRHSRADVDKILRSEALPPVTVIVPMYNEQENIVNMLESFFQSTYQNTFITIVNDASTDESMGLLIEKYQLIKVPITIDEKIKTSAVSAVYISINQQNLMVIEKAHQSGAGDSVNIGINACFTPYFMTVDADSMMAPTAISEFVYEIMTEPRAIVVGGGVYILNGCEYKNGIMLHAKLPKKLVPALQAIEYMRSHLFGRSGWNPYGGTMTYSGTATLFDRKVAVQAGGFDTQNFSQDAEIIMRINAYMRKEKQRYKILFNPAVAIWTDVPTDLKSYAIQRDRWRRGLLRSTLRYWYMFLNPRYGIQGMLSYPAYILLEILAPMIEFTAYISVMLAYFLGIFSFKTTLLYIILAWGFISYITIANMFINLISFNHYKRASDIFKVFLLTFVEMFGFRQYGVAIAMFGTFHYFFNRLRGKPL